MSDNPIDDEVQRLVEAWCDRRDLRSLRTILSGWPRTAGLTDDWGLLMEALRTLRADRQLPPDEHERVERLVVDVERLVYRS